MRSYLHGRGLGRVARAKIHFALCTTMVLHPSTIATLPIQTLCTAGSLSLNPTLVRSTLLIVALYNNTIIVSCRQAQNTQRVVYCRVGRGE